MSNATYVGPRLKAFRSTPQLDGYTRVIIVVADGVEITSGDTLGRTLRINNPWGTQEMADSILRLVKGFQYQPYEAEGAQVDPAAELGDGITVNSVYSGLYKQSLRYDSLSLSRIAAPTEQAIDHEYPYKSRPNKEITRETRLLRSALRVQADRITAEVQEREEQGSSLQASLDLQAGQIAAKVEKTGGDPSSFGWALDDSSWTIKANSTDVLKATKNGLEVFGKVTATSGKIGGFDITADSLTYNNQGWGGTNTTGIYIGPSGIQLGRNFKVDAAGNLTAASGTFLGTVRAGNIQHGGDNGTLHASALTGHSITGSQIGYGAISTAYTSRGINVSLGYADYANEVFSGISTAQLIGVHSLFADVTHFSQLRVDFGGQERVIGYDTISINGKSYRVLTF